MTGLNIKICFWYLDAELLDEVLKVLEGGKISLTYCDCQDRASLQGRLKENPPELILADFDASHEVREVIDQEMEDHYSEVPLIYLVHKDRMQEASEVIRIGVWDVVQKDQLFKLIPSVYSSQKYSSMSRERIAAEKAVKESRDRYMSIFKTVSDGILLFNFAGLGDALIRAITSSMFSSATARPSRMCARSSALRRSYLVRLTTTS